MNIIFLRKILDFYYELFGNLNIPEIAQKRGIEIDCVIEAGCHDGTDTVILEGYFKPKRYLAFEPDKTARISAEALLKKQNIHSVSIFDFGLSDKDSSGFLKYEAEGAGSGSSHFGDTGDERVSVKAFDEHFEINNHKALLWLDVEGHAQQVLSGMQIALKNVYCARVEVQLHTRNLDFKRDYRNVIKMMKKASLIPIYGPVYPGYFGDIVFIKSSHMSATDLVRSTILRLQFVIFHNGIYPLINRPKRVRL